MKNVWKSGASQRAPTATAYAEGFPTEGSSETGTDATVPGAFWYHMITQEIQNAIIGGGIRPDAGVLNQLDLAIKAQLKTLNDAIAAVNQRITNIDVVPTATIMAFDLDAPPSNEWLVCDGRAVSRSVYANLFAKIGTRHGSGNGVDTFNIPNLVGRVLWGATSGIGGMIEAGLPNITGNAEYYSWSYVINKSGALKNSDNGSGGGYGDSGRGGSRIGLKFDASLSNDVYGKSATVQPPAMKTLFCIHI